MKVTRLCARYLVKWKYLRRRNWTNAAIFCCRSRIWK
jgi:hypothetical protein